MGRSIYRPNYAKLYPNISITPEVREVLTKSDRKMEYAEQDKKQETYVEDQETETAYFVPAKEDSYERLTEELHYQFPAAGAGFEDAVLARIIVEELLDKLPDDESALIRKIYLEGLTEEEYGVVVGVHKNTVNYRRKKILEKLKNFQKS